MIDVKVKKMYADVQLPEYATEGSACFDIRAYDEWSVPPGCSEVFNTGLQFEIPEQHVMLVFSRSGHGFKHDVSLSNSVGVVDSDYRGELKVKLHNSGDEFFKVDFGDRIAQGMVVPYEQVKFVVTDELSSTERGEGGFGSTGAA